MFVYLYSTKQSIMTTSITNSTLKDIIEAQEKVNNALNLDAVKGLKKATDKLKKYTIEDVTPEGYGI